MTSYQYRKSHCGDKTVVRSSYLHNEISYTGNFEMTYLYWIRAQVVFAVSVVFWPSSQSMFYLSLNYILVNEGRNNITMRHLKSLATWLIGQHVVILWQRKHQTLHTGHLWVKSSRGFPSQRASNAKSISMPLHHYYDIAFHEYFIQLCDRVHQPQVKINLSDSYLFIMKAILVTRMCHLPVFQSLVRAQHIKKISLARLPIFFSKRLYQWLIAKLQ